MTEVISKEEFEDYRNRMSTSMNSLQNQLKCVRAAQKELAQQLEELKGISPIQHDKTFFAKPGQSRCGYHWGSDEAQWVYEEMELRFKAALEAIAEKVGRSPFAIQCHLQRMGWTINEIDI